ncbi:hypothetical protein BOTBODRAFT_25887 [Botryobasidium botryosum FD-172 SS1]|uniref:Tr-type G domain-containing protein n=1 Tax=Botryobasidium botryosum (strain FD-172 SS1) TaxID=930990 RepID=A0A067N0C6_BOTB1|nr:hypothetical protein BOTBODRAFT_25887 [Botryobasidium botryosum FD-172 SS1]
MAALRSFQEEIQQVQRAHAPRQRTQGSVPTDGGGSSATASGDADGSETIELQDLLISTNPDAVSTARDTLASLLTTNRGEYLLSLGQHPPRMSILGIANSDIVDVQRGKPLDEDGLRKATARLTELVDDMGGVATTLYESVPPTYSFHLLRLPPLSVERTLEVRCAVVGNVDSGKSTTLGVLTRGSLDDGRGVARTALFRHKHEIESGRTSSVGMEILGFSTAGKPILAGFHHGTAEANAGLDPTAFAPPTARREKIGWDEISVQAAKIVSFSDLAGHERYLKTTLYGMTSGAPDVVFLIVGGNAGTAGMMKEHLAISLALSVPVVVIITKVDMTPPNKLEETIQQVVKIVKSPGCRKTPVFVKTAEIAIELSQSFTQDRICPIFQTSNVTGQGLDLLRVFLNLLPSSEGDESKYATDQPFEYSVTDVWSVPYVGVVTNGIINSGRITAGDSVLLGPDPNGGWVVTSVKSIQRKRATVTSAEAGQCVSLALKRVRRAAVRKGQVIVHKSDEPPKAIHVFEGQVLILYHNTTLQRGYQAMLHCGAIRQTVRILSIEHPQQTLRTGDRAVVRFEFISRPEYLKEGMKLLFREGKTKGLGVVTRLL